MFEAEDKHWWYQGLRRMMFTMLRLHQADRKSTRILDAGCGTGGNLASLRKAEFQCDGFDFSPVAVQFCHERGLDNVVRGSITEIPYADRTFDIVISCDVLNDAGTDDEARALSEILRVLKPGGRVFLNLPAFSFLRGEHDRATDVARRYTRKEISTRLVAAGFKPVRLTYWNLFLFPLVLVVRRVRHGNVQTGPARSDITTPPLPINRLLGRLLMLEGLLVKVSNLPLGSSLAVVARRPK